MTDLAPVTDELSGQSYSAAGEAELAELRQCRDHWKISYEDARKRLEEAERVIEGRDGRIRYLERQNVDLVSDNERVREDLNTAIRETTKATKQLARYREGFRPIREVDAEILVACIGRQPSPNEQIKMGGSAIKAIRDCVMTLEALKAVEGDQGSEAAKG